ncbi:AraC family transcriptional regulator [Streptococcus hillyeri]|uniref:AraC family transcriptional regulator n=1 Tax=Streptococcus hillyeri TaxID=2282420 RepID=A0A3L9DPR5_9STRE|nr:AraC family transcriptional regulator [Streptococcus hillyeri]RLY01933.1 AraC family transcriptional regulator [Streptococcus hillyeri]
MENSHHLLPYRFERMHIQNGRPDTLFHWHPEMEVHYIFSGRARYHIDYDIFNSNEGDIVLVHPNGMHSIHPLEKAEQISEAFICHLDMIGQRLVDQTSLHYLQPLQNSALKFVPRIQPHMAGYEDIKSCVLTILELAKKEGRHFELFLKAKLNELLYLLFLHRHVLKKATDDTYRKNAKIRQVIDHINNHYQENLSIHQLATLIGYSKAHFMSLFKQHTGSSCTDFIIRVRLQKASQLLIHSHDSILEIAEQTGFTNLSHFNRQFKKQYLLTPRQYRQEHSKKKDTQNFINP